MSQRIVLTIKYFVVKNCRQNLKGKSIVLEIKNIVLKIKNNA